MNRCSFFRSVAAAIAAVVVPVPKAVTRIIVTGTTVTGASASAWSVATAARQAAKALRFAEMYGATPSRLHRMKEESGIPPKLIELSMKELDACILNTITSKKKLLDDMSLQGDQVPFPLAVHLKRNPLERAANPFDADRGPSLKVLVGQLRSERERQRVLRGSDDEAMEVEEADPKHKLQADSHPYPGQDPSGRSGLRRD